MPYTIAKIKFNRELNETKIIDNVIHKQIKVTPYVYYDQYTPHGSRYKREIGLPDMSDQSYQIIQVNKNNKLMKLETLNECYKWLNKRVKSDSGRTLRFERGDIVKLKHNKGWWFSSFLLGKVSNIFYSKHTDYQGGFYCEVNYQIKPLSEFELSQYKIERIHPLGADYGSIENTYYFNSYDIELWKAKSGKEGKYYEAMNECIMRASSLRDNDEFMVWLRNKPEYKELQKRLIKEKEAELPGIFSSLKSIIKLIFYPFLS